MRVLRNATAGFLFFLAFAGSVRADGPLVDVAWVKENLTNDFVRILDLRPETLYLRSHISGAVHSRYYADGWRAVGRDRLRRLPAREKFESLVSRLGIGNRTHVVIVAQGREAVDLAEGHLEDFRAEAGTAHSQNNYISKP